MYTRTLSRCFCPNYTEFVCFLAFEPMIMVLLAPFSTTFFRNTLHSIVFESFPDFRVSITVWHHSCLPGVLIFFLFIFRLVSPDGRQRWGLPVRCEWRWSSWALSVSLFKNSPFASLSSDPNCNDASVKTHASHTHTFATGKLPYGMQPRHLSESRPDQPIQYMYIDYPSNYVLFGSPSFS